MKCVNMHNWQYWELTFIFGFLYFISSFYLCPVKSVRYVYVMLVVVQNVTEDVFARVLFFSLVALRQHSV